MIPAGMQVFVATQPVDLRAGFERLTGLARERIGYELSESALFVFFGRRRDTVKIVFVDGTGRCLFHKKLHRGTFAPLDALAPDATHVELDVAAFEALLDGLPIAPEAPVSTKRPRRLH